jgi:hypothetical protein
MVPLRRHPMCCEKNSQAYPRCAVDVPLLAFESESHNYAPEGAPVRAAISAVGLSLTRRKKGVTWCLFENTVFNHSFGVWGLGCL